MAVAKIRLHVSHRLAGGQPVPLSQPQAHYLFGVMRLGVGAPLLLFNGQDGEWLAEVAEAGKRGGTLSCSQQTKPQGAPPDLWLVFAPIKKARTDFVVEKAVELGVARIVPVATEFTNAERIKPEKMLAHATEAAEQCGATYLAEVAPLESLDKMLETWPANRRLLFCDEAEGASLKGAELASLAQSGTSGAWAILIGPEGGFSPSEREKLRSLNFVVPISLGPRILRAETAALAALTLWQAALGDWR